MKACETNTFLEITSDKVWWWNFFHLYLSYSNLKGKNLQKITWNKWKSIRRLDSLIVRSWYSRIFGKGKTIDFDKMFFFATKKSLAGLPLNKEFLVFCWQHTETFSIPIVRESICPEMLISLYEWKTYSGKNRGGYHHETVNHSQHFLDPFSFCHKNSVKLKRKKKNKKRKKEKRKNEN